MAYDVVVVGAGPAGSVTALMLARGGVSVCLVDKAAFPRPKLCGEGLMPAGVRQLELLGLRASVRPISQPFRGLTFRVGLRTVELDFSTSEGLVVPRNRFDQILNDSAVEAGVCFLPGFEVTDVAVGTSTVNVVSRDGKTVQASFLVGTDGIHSPLHRIFDLKRRSGRPKRLALQATAFTASDGTRVEIFAGDSGEAYVAPLGGRKARVTLLLDSERINSGSRKAFFQNVLRELALQDRYRFNGTGGITATSPISLSVEPIYGRRFLLAGDAAGVADAITGQGMTLALRDAAAASKAVVRFLANGQDRPLQEYALQRRRYLDRSRQLAAVLLRVMGSPSRFQRAANSIEGNERMRARMAAIATGADEKLLTRWEKFRLSLGF